MSNYKIDFESICTCGTFSESIDRYVVKKWCKIEKYWVVQGAYRDIKTAEAYLKELKNE